MNVLLTGGAGYIGSHLVRALGEQGYGCVVLDNLVNGHRESIAGTKLVVADVADAEATRNALKDNDIELVVHLAAFAEAGESVIKPEKYFGNNTVIGLTLLEAMRDVGVGKMVFSSTAAVYGEPERIPIQETDRLDPINPYGASKLCVEFMMRAYARAYGMGFVALRYFNVAGADPNGNIGEDHDPESHLVPLILRAAMERSEKVRIFGDDYDTADGTCVRDYIHVCDLADAHILAIDAIEAGSFKAFNLGNGEGFSVKEVIDAAGEVTGRKIPAEVAPRREGDPPQLVASSDRAKRELHWRPKYPKLEQIIAHAWTWHKGHPNGY